MSNATIFDPIPWEAVGMAALQTAVIYWVVILGLKLVGRRVFGELAPHELVLLLLISESADVGLTPQEGGFWSTMASAITLLSFGALNDRLTPLRKVVEENAIFLMENGRLLKDVMKKSLVDEEELKSLARKYGFPDYSVFDSIALESDGSLSGVLKPEYRQVIIPVGGKLRTE